MRALSRYRTFFLILLGAATLGALGLTSWVNPWRVTPAPWSDSGFEPYRDIEGNWNATTKTGLVRSERWDAALFGSSRTDIALDPRHPAFEGLRCANLGLNAAGIGENHAIFSYFMDHEESPCLVVFSIDPGDISTPDRKRFKGDFPLSPLDPASDPVERELRYRAGVTALAACGETISRRLRDQPAEHTPQGFRRNAEFPEDQRRLVASLYLPVTYRYALKHKRTDALNPHKLALVDDIIRRCREKGARLVFFIPPNQALFMLTFRELGDPDPFFARDRRALAERVAAANAAAPDAPPVELWDFLDAHPLNCQPLPPPDDPAAHMEDWLDIYHSAHPIGNLMLDRLLPENPSPVSPPYGVLLAPDLVDSRVAAIASGLDAYAAAHPGDIAFLRNTLAKFQE